MILLLPFVGFLGTCALALPSPATDSTISGQAISLPSDDAFYAAPVNLSAYEPGSIIRSRIPPAPLAFFSAKTNLKSAQQLLYRTTGSNGEPLATVTTVLVPHNADFGKLLSYQVEIDAPYNACFPSITLQQPGANLGTISSQYGELWFISALAKGWIVAVPDHEGPNGAFTDGVLGGHATLDGLRAVLRSKDVTGVLPEAKTVIWGYSGGAQATEFALELHEEYAPELNISAAAMGGNPANLQSALNKINGGIGAGLVGAAILGQAKSVPAIQDIVNDKTISATKSTLQRINNQCLIPTVVEFAYQDMFKYFNGGKTILQDPAVVQILQSNIMGKRAVPKVPMYIYHAVNDELLPIQDVENLVQDYCSGGATISFTRESFGDHVIAGIAGAAGALSYLFDRMDGKPLAPGCNTRTVLSSILDPASLPVLGDFVVNDILALLGSPVGPVSWLKEASV